MVEHTRRYDGRDVSDRPSPIRSFLQQAHEVSASSVFSPVPSAQGSGHSFATLADQIHQLSALLKRLPVELQTPQSTTENARSQTYPGDANLIDLGENTQPSPYFVQPNATPTEAYRNPGYANSSWETDIPIPSVSTDDSANQEAISNLVSPGDPYGGMYSWRNGAEGVCTIRAPPRRLPRNTCHMGRQSHAWQREPQVG